MKVCYVQKSKSAKLCKSQRSSQAGRKGLCTEIVAPQVGTFTGRFYQHVPHHNFLQEYLNINLIVPLQRHHGQGLRRWAAHYCSSMMPIENAVFRVEWLRQNFGQEPPSNSKPTNSLTMLFKWSIWYRNALHLQEKHFL